jgi:hypothetical protein
VGDAKSLVGGCKKTSQILILKKIVYYRPWPPMTLLGHEFMLGFSRITYIYMVSVDTKLYKDLLLFVWPRIYQPIISVLLAELSIWQFGRPFLLLLARVSPTATITVTWQTISRLHILMSSKKNLMSNAALSEITLVLSKPFNASLLGKMTCWCVWSPLIKNGRIEF